MKYTINIAVNDPKSELPGHMSSAECDGFCIITFKDNLPIASILHGIGPLSLGIAIADSSDLLAAATIGKGLAEAHEISNQGLMKDLFGLIGKEEE